MTFSRHSCVNTAKSAIRRIGHQRNGVPASCFVLVLFLVFVFAPASSLASVNFRAAASASSTSNGIAYVSVGTAVFSDTGGNVTPGLPGSIQNGDLIICLVESYDNVAHTTATAGWTQLYTLMGASATHRASLFYRIAAAPNTALTVTHTSGSTIISRCAAYRGVDTTTPFDVAYAAQYSASDTTVETGSLTPVNDDVMLLFAGHIANRATTTIPLTVAGGLTWTERIDSNRNNPTGSADVAIWLDEAPMATAAAIGPLQETGSLAGVSHGVLLALRGNPTPLTISVPTGTAAGDVMIASVASTPSSTTINTPSGWTLIRQSTQGSATTSKLATYYRVATTTEPSVHTWTFSGSGLTQSVGGISSFRGVDTSSPYDAETGGATNSSLNHIAPTVTTTLDDGMLVTVHEMASSVTWTPPLISGTTRMTEAVDVASLTPNNAAGISMEMNYEVRATAGATGTRTAVASANADRGATQSVSLRPTPLVCWSDSFNRADGPPGSDWIVSNSGGTFGDPVIFSNRLRMTNTAGNLATMAKLQRLFPGAGNRIEVEFEHFAYGGSGADGIAVTFSDSSVTPAPGAYGGSLGYAQRSTPSVVNGFAGGWLGVGIDEYGNFSNPTEGRQGGPGFFVDSVSIRGSGSGTTGYTYHAGTGTLTPQVDNNGAASPPHKYRIIVDHSNAVNAFVSVERNTGTGYATLVAPYDAKAQAGQAAVPTSWLLSYTGSSGGSTNIHEIDSLRICATSQSSLSTNHFAISHSGTGVNCQAEAVTITAHDGSHNAVTLSAATTITLTTSTGLGDWTLTTGLGTLTNGTANDGSATYQFGNESSVVLALKHTTPAPSPGVSINVTDGTITETSGIATGAEDAGLIFAPSGFRFTDGTNPVTIGTQISGKESNVAPGAQNLYLQAIDTDTNTGACVGVFPGGSSVNVEMASQCSNPTTCVAGKQVSITNNATTTAIASNPNTGVSSYTSVPLLFGASSQALLSFNYPDAGSISLHARYNIPLAGGGASSDNMLGSSAAFVVRPFGFRISGPSSGQTGASSTVFTTAGTSFNTTLTAVVWESADDADNDGVPDSQSALSANAATPNFGQETTAATATLSHALAEPAGGAPGSLTGSTSFTGFTSGAKTQSVIFSEVGIIDLLATTTNYLGSGQIINAGANGLTGVGRFIPHHFDVTKIDGCTGGATFTYAGQPFTVTVTAKNAAGGATDITTNYDGTLGFSKAVTISNAGTTTNFANNNITAANFASGLRNQTNVTYTYPVASKETATATLTLRAIEDAGGDGVSSAGYTEDSAEIRSGRLRIFNAYGSELADLPVPMRVEYYSTDGWVANTNDTCSLLTLSALSNFQNNLNAGETCVQDTGNPGVSGQGCAVAGPIPERFTSTPVSGGYNLYLKAPGTANDGSVDVGTDLSAKTWLRYDWDGDSTEDDPTGRATFGLYRGSPRHIYQRERY